MFKSVEYQCLLFGHLLREQRMSWLEVITVDEIGIIVPRWRLWRKWHNDADSYVDWMNVWFDGFVNSSKVGW